MTKLLFADFRLANTKCMGTTDSWKRLSHTNLVQLREVFTTKAFGDHCKRIKNARIIETVLERKKK